MMSSIAKLLTAATLILFSTNMVAGTLSRAENASAARVRAIEIVTASINALGGEDALRSVKTLTLTGNSYTNHLQDSQRPNGPYLVNFEAFTTNQDLEGRRFLKKLYASTASSMPQARTMHEELNAGGIDAHLREVDGKMTVSYTRAAHDDWYALGPLRLMLTAKSAADLHALGSAVIDGMRLNAIGFTWKQTPVKVYVNPATHFPRTVEYRKSYPDAVALDAWGDMLVRVTYSNWALEPGGMHFPLQTNTSLDGRPLGVTALTGVVINPRFTAASFAVTDAIKRDYAHEIHDVNRTPLGAPGNGDPGLPIKAIEPGVVQIPGEWYVTLIRQQDGIVVLEAPISAGYSEKVIQEAKRRFPGERIKAVISTSNYWWHIAGIRQYAARGTPIYVLDRNKSLISELLSAPHRMHPDLLSQKPAPARLRVVSSAVRIGSGRNELVLYPIRTSTTSQMLMVYFPSYKLLYSSDMAQPLGKNDAFVAPEYLWDLEQAVKARHLDVSTLIGMHMSPTPWTKLVDSVNAVIDESL